MVNAKSVKSVSNVRVARVVGFSGSPETMAISTDGVENPNAAYIVILFEVHLFASLTLTMACNNNEFYQTSNPLIATDRRCYISPASLPFAEDAKARMVELINAGLDLT